MSTIALQNYAFFTKLQNFFKYHARKGEKKYSVFKGQFEVNSRTSIGRWTLVI